MTRHPRTNAAAHTVPPQGTQPPLNPQPPASPRATLNSRAPLNTRAMLSALPTRRALLTGLAALSTAGTLSACSNGLASRGAGGGSDRGGAGGDANAITVGLTYIPNVQFSAFYLGEDAGIFADHGLTVTIRHHGEQEDLFGALLAGREDAVYASADEGVVATANGQRIFTFATAYQQYPIALIGPDKSALPADASATSGGAESPDVDASRGLQVMKGKTIGIPGRYGSTYYAALAALKLAGLTEQDVTLSEIGFTQLASLEAGHVDFIMGFVNNEAVQLRAAGKDPLIIPLRDADGEVLVGPSLLTHPTRENSKNLRALSDALREAEQAVKANPEAALDATAKRVPALVDPAARDSAKAVLEATMPLWETDGEITTDPPFTTMERMTEFLVDAEIIPTAPDATSIRV